MEHRWSHWCFILGTITSQDWCFVFLQLKTAYLMNKICLKPSPSYLPLIWAVSKVVNRVFIAIFDFSLNSAGSVLEGFQKIRTYQKCYLESHKRRNCGDTGDFGFSILRRTKCIGELKINLNQPNAMCKIKNVLYLLK